MFSETLYIIKNYQVSSIMPLHPLLNSALPRAITAIIMLGFTPSDYCINLRSAVPRATKGVIALHSYTQLD